ncbi:MAG: phosphatase PAP2 family protein [Alphaproteobacteria bacterium]|nr:phosphatase PAP2 family protein [Alphaproteobacteria bacterium]
MTVRPWTTTGMLKVCAITFVALTIVFLPFPQIDLWVAEIFYKGENDFWLRKTEFNAFLNAYVRHGVGYVAVGGLLLFLFLWLTRPLDRLQKLARYGFLFVCIFLSTGLVVHAVLKDNWGRARPKHVTQFDGEYVFTPPLLPADQCRRNCSFVSGDASVGYVTLALALYATRRRKFWICMSVTAGLGLGLMRMMNGSHFFSDVLYSGVFTCGGVLLLYRWIVEKHWHRDMAPVRRTLGPIVGPVLRPLGRGLKALWLKASTPGMRMGLDRAGIRLRRLFEPVV